MEDSSKGRSFGNPSMMPYVNKGARRRVPGYSLRGNIPSDENVLLDEGFGRFCSPRVISMDHDAGPKGGRIKLEPPGKASKTSFIFDIDAL
ncbi:hypothetical protein EJD97_008834 [Solanum chilense]|uniref:Uncharacterized protein n=1 Tax=Solanum chilense TaxID=4083 RepID=A0A6N2AGH5_SOLCI|nr:hypothetical protein EJD97_008834 [Solanum chilense]